MKTLIHIFLLFLTPTFLFAQYKLDKLSDFEMSYVTSSNNAIEKTIGKDRFDKYLSFSSLYWYSLKGDLMTFPKDITDTLVTHIITSYMVVIPEIKYFSTTELIYEKKSNCRYFKDSLNLPKYILQRRALDLLDTAAIKILFVKKGVDNEKLKLSNCSFNEEFKRFTWFVSENIIPFDEATQTWTINSYVVDASSGQFLKEEKNKKFHANLNVRGTR